MLIKSPQNQRIKNVVHLRRRRERDKQNLMIIEGYRQLLRAHQNHYPVNELFVCPDLFQGPNEHWLIERFQEKGTVITETAADPFYKMAYRDRPEGLLGVAPQRRASLADVMLSYRPLILIAETIEKPGNLGTIMRSVDAAGADALVVSNPCTDLFNPNVVRASVGTMFAVQTAETTFSEVSEWLREHRITPVVATPHAEKLYTETELTGPVAIVVGAEQYGVSSEWLMENGKHCRIPMQGQADSLNVASTVTLLLYEAVRQRQPGL